MEDAATSMLASHYPIEWPKVGSRSCSACQQSWPCLIFERDLLQKQLDKVDEALDWKNSTMVSGRVDAIRYLQTFKRDRYERLGTQSRTIG